MTNQGEGQSKAKECSSLSVQDTQSPGHTGRKKAERSSLRRPARDRRHRSNSLKQKAGHRECERQASCPFLIWIDLPEFLIDSLLKRSPLLPDLRTHNNAH